jgi:hypothetical protein
MSEFPSDASKKIGGDKINTATTLNEYILINDLYINAKKYESAKIWTQPNH